MRRPLGEEGGSHLNQEVPRTALGGEMGVRAKQTEAEGRVMVHPVWWMQSELLLGKLKLVVLAQIV